MIAVNNRKNEFEEIENRKDDLIHVHFIHKHVPTAVSYTILILFTTVIGLSVFLLENKTVNSTQIILQKNEGGKNDFVYGSWPVLQNAEFFKKVKEKFISQDASFIEADLSAMQIRFYKNGNVVKEASIQTKGREGSWWETPAGLYKIISKEKNHFSSFGRVYMPYSMQFQGNFFIHGPTYYPDGSPTSAAYSGGCIRIPLKDVEEIYQLAEIGTPVLIFEKSFNNSKEDFKYGQKKLLKDNVSYLAVDLGNNFVFAENNSNDKHSIGSIAKLMSALVAVEYINVEKEIKISSSMLTPTEIPRLKKGNSITVLDLLSLMLLESSNEAEQAIIISLGKNQFIKLINMKAEAIGMKDSVFTDTSEGSSVNISTAEDLFSLAKYLYHNRSFVLHMSLGNENRGAYNSLQYRNLQNFNLVSEVAGMIGGKTSQNSLTNNDSMLAVFEIDIDGVKRPVAIVVLGSSDAKNDVKNLLEYIKDNFSSKNVMSL